MPTRPFDHGCSAAHSTVSYPSSTSTAIGAQSPSDSKRPRESWYTTAYPARTTSGGSALSRPLWSMSRPYGVRDTSTGTGDSVFGRHRSA